MLADTGERVSAGTYLNGLGGNLDARLRDSIEAEVQPDAALSRGIATALRSNLAQTDAGDSAFGALAGKRANDRATPAKVNSSRSPTDKILAEAVAIALKGDSEPLYPKSHSPVEQRHRTDGLMPSDLEDRIAFALGADTRS